MQFQRRLIVTWMLLMSSAVNAQQPRNDLLTSEDPLTERYRAALWAGALGNLQQARKDLLLVLGEEPSHGSAKLRLKLLDDVDAKKIPAATAVHLFKSVLLGVSGHLAESLGEANAGIELSPNYAEAYRLRGRTRVEVAEYDDALDDYTRAIKLDASNVEAYQNRANLRLARGDFARALADCNEAVRLAPSNPENWDNRGAALALGHQPERALHDLNKAIELDPGLPQPYINKSELYAREGRRREAIETLKELLSRARPTYRAEIEYAKQWLKQLESTKVVAPSRS